MLIRLAIFFAAAAFAIAGCAFTYQGRLPAGVAGAADVERVMGTPWVKFPDANGGSVWVYPTGPLGRSVYHVRLDAAGTVRSVEDIMNDKGFARLEIGKSTKEDVLRMFGPPFLTTYFERRHELAWDYRFLDAWQYAALFHVLFDDQGVVTQTMQLREFQFGSQPDF